MTDRPSLATLAREINAELDPEDPAGGRALEIARELRIARPDTTAAGRQRAAAKAAGAEAPLTGAEITEAIEGPAGRTSRRARRLARRIPRAVAKRPVTRTLRGLVFQALGLVALYWFISNAESISRVINAMVRIFDWLKSTRGIPG